MVDLEFLVMGGRALEGAWLGLVLGVFEYIPGMSVGRWTREGLRGGPGRDRGGLVGRSRGGLWVRDVVECSGLALV